MKLSVVIAFVLAFASGAYALGVGAYGSAGGGVVDYGKISLPAYSDPRAEVITSRNINAGGGFMLDTNCARDEVFNYRLTIGGERLFSKKNWVRDMKRVFLTNTFGLGIVRSRWVRLWAGPQIGFGYLYGSTTLSMHDYTYHITEGGNIILSMNNIPGAARQYRLGHSLYGACLGFAVGFNINFAKNITLAFDGGARYYILYGVQTSDVLLFEQCVTAFNRWIASSGYEGYGSIGVLYRINDEYSEEKADTIEGEGGV